MSYGGGHDYSSPCWFGLQSPRTGGFVELTSIDVLDDDTLGVVHVGESRIPSKTGVAALGGRTPP